jgi:hypothetical protein
VSAALIAMTWRSEPALAGRWQTALAGCAVTWFGLASTAERRGSGRPVCLAPTSADGGVMIWMITAMPARRCLPDATAQLPQ